MALSASAATPNLRGRRDTNMAATTKRVLPNIPRAKPKPTAPAQLQTPPVSITPTPVAQPPLDPYAPETMTELVWTSEGGAVRLNGKPFHIKGEMMMMMMIVMMMTTPCLHSSSFSYSECRNLMVWHGG